MRIVRNTSFREQSRTVTLLWSAKESALKALHEGLRLDTRSIVVQLAGEEEPPSRWKNLRVRSHSGNTFRGWWRTEGNFVETVVASPPPEPPIQLTVSPHSSEEEICYRHVG